MLVSKRTVGNGGGLEQEEEEVFRGIDVNEEARVSDLMGENDGSGDGAGTHSDGIGFNIDVDVGAPGDDVFGLW